MSPQQQLKIFEKYAETKIYKVTQLYIRQQLNVLMFTAFIKKKQHEVEKSAGKIQNIII